MIRNLTINDFETVDIIIAKSNYIDDIVVLEKRV